MIGADHNGWPSVVGNLSGPGGVIVAANARGMGVSAMDGVIRCVLSVGADCGVTLICCEGCSEAEAREMCALVTQPESDVTMVRLRRRNPGKWIDDTPVRCAVERTKDGRLTVFMGDWCTNVDAWDLCLSIGDPETRLEVFDAASLSRLMGSHSYR